MSDVPDTEMSSPDTEMSSRTLKSVPFPSLFWSTSGSPFYSPSQRGEDLLAGGACLSLACQNCQELSKPGPKHDQNGYQKGYIYG